jgi:transposase
LTQSIVISGRERRRRWSTEQKQAVLAAAFAPGAITANVCRRFEISTGLLYRWRQEARAAEGATHFVPAVIVGDGRGHAAEMAAITIEVRDGLRVSIAGHASPALVQAALRALR